MKRILAILLISLFATGAVFAGERPKAATRTLILSGKVSDPKSQELLAGVKITCEACDKVVYSDLDGRFFIHLQVDPAANATIEFSQVGYTAKTLKLQDIGAQAGNLDVSLEQE